MKRCIIKRVKNYNPIENKIQVSGQKTQKVENKPIEVMDTKEKIELANQILGTEPKIKRIKKKTISKVLFYLSF